MITQRVLTRVDREVKRLGGRLCIVSDADYERLFFRPDGTRRGGYSECPFDLGLGVHYRTRSIYVVASSASVGPLIHEIGHVLAQRVEPDNALLDEYDSLGFEIAFARQIGIYRRWSEQNMHYAVDRMQTTWGEVTTRQSNAARAIKAALDRGREVGNVTRSGAPRSIRVKRA